jgi:hypothetical protein
MMLVALVLGIVFVAQGQVARANQSSDPRISARDGEKQSGLPNRTDNCDKDKNKDKDKCKGTVKPPPKEILIPVTGEYSVGGFCTLSAVLNDPKINLEAGIITPLPRDLPDKVHKVRQGCLLTYTTSNQRLDELAPASGNTTICFAATPQQQMTIYFHNFYDPNPQWVPLATTVQNGIACAAANQSGVYVATFQTP